MATITVAVDKKGKLQMLTKGVQGSACSLLTKRYTDALGTVESDEKTGEFYQNPEQKVRVEATESAG